MVKPSKKNLWAALIVLVDLLGPVTALAGETAPPDLAQGDFSTALVSMLSGLALVLGLLLLLYWFARRLAPRGLNLGGSSMRLRGRLALGPRKYVVLVEVAGKVLVLGVGPDRINLLTTLDDPSFLDEEPARTMGPKSFLGMMKRASERGEDKDS